MIEEGKDEDEKATESCVTQMQVSLVIIIIITLFIIIGMYLIGMLKRIIHSKSQSIIDSSGNYQIHCLEILIDIIILIIRFVFFVQICHFCQCFC